MKVEYYNGKSIIIRNPAPAEELEKKIKEQYKEHGANQNPYPFLMGAFYAHYDNLRDAYLELLEMKNFYQSQNK